MITQAPDAQTDEMMALMAFDEHRRSGLPLPDAIRATVAEFPRQAVSIADYTMQASVLGSDESSQTSNPVAVKTTLIALVDKIAQSKLQQQSSDTITSIISRAESVLGSSATLAQTLEVGQSLLLKLDRRMIQFGTIPAAFLQVLADKLQLSRAAIDDYLQMPPRLALSADYKSRKRPEATTQTFDQAMAASLATGEIEAGTRPWQATPDE